MAREQALALVMVREPVLVQALVREQVLALVEEHLFQARAQVEEPLIRALVQAVVVNLLQYLQLFVMLK